MPGNFGIDDMYECAGGRIASLSFEGLKDVGEPGLLNGWSTTFSPNASPLYYRGILPKSKEMLHHLLFSEYPRFAW